MPTRAASPVAMLSTADVAARLSVGTEQVVALIHSGKLAAVNVSVGRKPRWRIDPEALADFLAAARGKAPQPAARRKKLKAAGVTEFF